MRDRTTVLFQAPYCWVGLRLESLRCSCGTRITTALDDTLWVCGSCSRVYEQHSEHWEDRGTSNRRVPTLMTARER